MANSITIDKLSAGYGAVKVLHDVSLNASDGETVALLGTNGNGKSTLIKCLTGQLKPTSGAIRAEIDGRSHDLTKLSAEAIVALGVILVPEGRRLFPQLSVEDNLILGSYRTVARAKAKENLEFCYDAFPRLKERRWQAAGSMSGGEQQMLALGRALMASPRVLVIDEPSVGLAPVIVSRMIEKIAELKAALNLIVVMAEQNFQQAIRIANRGYVLVHGRIEFSAASADDLRRSDIVRKLYLGV